MDSTPKIAMFDGPAMAIAVSEWFETADWGRLRRSP